MNDVQFVEVSTLSWIDLCAFKKDILDSWWKFLKDSIKAIGSNVAFYILPQNTKEI